MEFVIPAILMIAFILLAVRVARGPRSGGGSGPGGGGGRDRDDNGAE